MNGRFIAMRAEGDTFNPRDKLFQHAGQARVYSMSKTYEHGGPYAKEITHDDGYVLIADFAMLPRVLFDPKGKPVGLGKDNGPTKLEEFEEAERMLEVWAKKAVRLRTELGLP